VSIAIGRAFIETNSGMACIFEPLINSMYLSEIYD